MFMHTLGGGRHTLGNHEHIYCILNHYIDWDDQGSKYIERRGLKIESWQIPFLKFEKRRNKPRRIRRRTEKVISLSEGRDI